MSRQKQTSQYLKQLVKQQKLNEQVNHRMVEPQYPKVIETFQSIGDYDLNRMSQHEPSCFNGKVEVEKYRVIIEKIDEPIEVVCERLEKLWVVSDNHHHYQPLQNKATQFNYHFKGDFGSQRHKK